MDEKTKAAEQVMPDYRIYSIIQDNHIASRPVTIVCEDDATAVQRSQNLLDRNDIQLWQGRRLDDRFHESCHFGGIHSGSFDSYIGPVSPKGAGWKSWQRGGGRLNCRSETRIRPS
jgi:hypothetical protein